MGLTHETGPDFGAGRGPARSPSLPSSRQSDPVQRGLGEGRDLPGGELGSGQQQCPLDLDAGDCCAEQLWISLRCAGLSLPGSCSWQIPSQANPCPALGSSSCALSREGSAASLSVSPGLPLRTRSSAAIHWGSWERSHGGGWHLNAFEVTDELRTEPGPLKHLS